MDLSQYLAIIPARAGSKRLAGKNFRDFCGKPLWRWAVECAVECGFPPVGIAVSSDRPYEDVREIENCRWVERWPELATDTAPSWWAVEHACYTLGHFGPVVVLQPTSPLRTPAQVRECIAEFERLQEKRIVGTHTGGEPNGGVYVAPWKAWEPYRAMWKAWEPYRAMWFPCDTGPDIDTQEDWDRAESMMRERLGGKG